eukprot:369856_1
MAGQNRIGQNTRQMNLNAQYGSGPFFSQSHTANAQPFIQTTHPHNPPTSAPQFVPRRPHPGPLPSYASPVPVMAQQTFQPSAYYVAASAHDTAHAHNRRNHSQKRHLHSMSRHRSRSSSDSESRSRSRTRSRSRSRSYERHRMRTRPKHSRDRHRRKEQRYIDQIQELEDEKKALEKE